jgi:protein TonB
MTTMMLAFELQLPWESSSEEDSRYRRILRNMLSAFIAFSLVVPWLPVEELTREQQVAVPPHLARVILEKKELPKAVPVLAKPRPKPKPKLKKKPKPVEKKAAPKPKPKAKAKPKPKPKPQDRVAQARKVAAVSGVLAFQDSLADMRDSLDVDSLNNTRVSRGQADAVKVQRSIITSSAKSSSGGIRTAQLSRDTGGPALSGRETTSVESTIASNYEAQSASASAQMGGRSDESIRRVMDKNKGGIFSVYNRALRKDATLQGKLVFEMVIDAAGAISELKLLSSELADAALTRKILARIRMIQFGGQDVITTRVNYSFDFLPY